MYSLWCTSNKIRVPSRIYVIRQEGLTQHMKTPSALLIFTIHFNLVNSF